MRLLLYTIASILIVCCSANRRANSFQNPSPRANEQPEKIPEQVSFGQHIRPIMSNTCFVCHGNDDNANESGLRLDSFEAAVVEGKAIVPGRPDVSPAWQRISSASDPMPPADFRHRLTEQEKSLFRKWIEQGAKYEQHWSYAPLVQPVPPATGSLQGNSIANPIDAFVLNRLHAEGLNPSPAASKPTLLRRLSLDLIGLPPSADDVAAFIADESSDAYEKQVDRLLASPHYGERMALRWLDLVRFSDTVGFHGDQNQRIFPYRDFVINSINKNQPFDEFTRWQLAGDLVDDPTDEQLIATGLVRLNMMTREGGAQPEEYLAKMTADRVRMIGTAWLGSSTGCCECHNHKYDPFTIEDFYSLGAFFDDVLQWGVYQNYGYTPNPDLSGFTNDHPFPPELRTKSEALERQIVYLENRLEQVCSNLVPHNTLNSDEFRRWVRQLTSIYENESDMWQELSPVSFASEVEQEIEVLPDSSIRFQNHQPQQDTVDLIYQFDDPAIIKSLRLEVLPDEVHNHRVGRSEGGRFNAQCLIYHYPAINEVTEAISLRPRYIRIELKDRQVLSLAEVQVFSKNSQNEEVNIALSGKASQSSTDYEGGASLAIDGNTDGNYSQSKSTTHTDYENAPWWELDLGEETQIHRVAIWNRTDRKFSQRLEGFQIKFLDGDRNTMLTRLPELPNPSISVEIPDEVSAVDLVPPTSIALSQADRYDPTRYSNGRPSPWLENQWRSGPTRWQLPADETGYPHTAVYHLNDALNLQAGQRLLVRLKSKDVGRVRCSVSPLSRFVVGNRSSSDNLDRALQSIAGGTQISKIDDNLQAALLSSFYQIITPTNRQSQRVKSLRNSIAECRSGYAMTLVSQSVDDTSRRQTRVLPRGDWQDNSGSIAVPNTPHFLPGYVAEPERRLDRLDLANWLMADDNPLVARSYVNRTWKHFFGHGLSETLDDLGGQGQWPSHPQLLDWLASEFRQDWDRKYLVRLIVTSNTYRQQAAVRRDLQDIDPDNRLLAQQSARRLEAEIIRDNALAISGLLLTDWIGGPSVFPYQPPGHYANLQFPNRRYQTDTDGRQYRRGVYMHWQRTFLHPMLTNFDAPSRDECAADRTLSNSPQQALTLLNDPVFVESCRAFAVRLMTEQPKSNIDGWITRGYSIALGREPALNELRSLRQLYLNQLEHFRANQDQADSFNAIGQFLSTIELDPCEKAAMAQVCRVILNLHETITRY